jgi:superfamily II DNA or RNA helicase
MAVRIEDLKSGVRVRHLSAAGDVTIVAVEGGGDAIVNVIYKTPDGGIDHRLVDAELLERLEIPSDRRWSFDADGAHFKLASEAKRIELAYLFDPFTAVDSATIRPLPHQIEAVYEKLLPAQPLNYLLADDPGAGKTIMSGLYIRELMLRGDLARCLIVAPGSLVEQWQDELFEKFGVKFEIMSRDMVEAALTGNPFAEKNLLIVRIDQLSRNDELKAKLAASEWDLVIVDEAHKMSARRYGDEVKRTLRYQLGEILRERARNLLLLTATPHNGSNDDFMLFMELIEPDVFGGRLRANQKLPDVSDYMRRYVKENLLTFEGTRLFPERRASTLKYELSDGEQRLYDAVTEYVKGGMVRAKQMEDSGDRRKGIAVGFALAALQRRLASSPDAIFHSLRRRRERLTVRLTEAKQIGDLQKTREVGRRIGDPDGFDADDFGDDEFEQLEDEAIEEAVLAEDIAELEVEIVKLRVLQELAEEVRNSREDSKWVKLREVLESPEFNETGERRKLIIFTEHKDTLSYLEGRIKDVIGRPGAVVTIHGGVKREERRRVQELFRNDPNVQILVATDAAGEGVNLQRANLMVNYDLPWNPNRLEQRFGRIHRIGQNRICYLWNLVAHETREGQVYERLLTKIEQQRELYKDQIYDVLGDVHLNKSLQDLLIEAIRDGDDPEVLRRIGEVIDKEVGDRAKAVLEEQALASNVLDTSSIAEMRDRMEHALARKLAPGFLEAFMLAVLDESGGRIPVRERGRFEITRVPAQIRGHERAEEGVVGSTYERVTFDKELIEVDGTELKAELITPGHPLLKSSIRWVLNKYEALLSTGTTFVDPCDDGVTPRVLIYLEHAITDGRRYGDGQRPVSQRFNFVEVSARGVVTDPGAEPYLNYAPISDGARATLTTLDTSWTDDGIDDVARNWAIEKLAKPHFEEVEDITRARVGRIRAAVEERLTNEIRYWDVRAAELKSQELQGKKPRLNSGRARQRADDLEARRNRRLAELDLEADLVNRAPNVIAAALIIPQGLIDQLSGLEPVLIDPNVAVETDKRAVAAVIAAERAIGRVPEEQSHNNPGFDILSKDPKTGILYFIEVKGHRPQTDEIHVRARQVRQAQQNPDRFRLAVVAVPNEPDVEPTVGYHLRPFDNYTMIFAQTYVPLNVSQLAQIAVEPQ